MLKPYFKLKPGEYYSEKQVRKGLEKAREIYGSGGYFEFTGYPDLKPRDQPNPSEPKAPEALTAAAPPPAGPPIVDVTMRMQEGKQYFVNRITFVGNTTTRDSVIRREMRLVENGVFNTEALKYSVKRLNQLGYFKPLEGGKDVNVDKTQGVDNKVDVRLKLEEQNRNQLTFGAGVSQFEGFFGQLSFQTANFLGRGESLTAVAADRVARAELSARVHRAVPLRSEHHRRVRPLQARHPLHRPVHAEVGRRDVTFGVPLGGFTRMFTNYSYERVRVTEIADVYQDPVVLQRNPFLRDSLLLGQGGERIISKVVPSIVHNTVDNPIFPTSGRRYTLSIDLAGLGGNTNFYRPLAEGVWYLKQANRLTLGLRGPARYIHTFPASKELPIFEKLFLGGEYSIRGFDIRTIGPLDPVTGLVLGGNKSLLFNVEEMISIAGPLRLIFFYDAGEVQPGPELRSPSAAVPAGGSPDRVLPGKNFSLQDFKTSTGAEVRFFMPVLNVPFRLIFAYNPQRTGVLDNSLQPQSGFAFRFAVGTTFWCKINAISFAHERISVMRGFVIATSLALALSAVLVFAQTPPASAPHRRRGRPRPPPGAPGRRRRSAGAKFAFVNFQRVIAESVEGKNSSTKVQALIAKKQNEGADKQKQLAAGQAKLQQGGGVMSDAARSALEKDIERMTVEGQRFQQDAQAEVQELQNELQNDFIQKVTPLLQQVATERGLHALFNAQEAGLAWADPGLDVTTDVIRKLDAASLKADRGA